MAADGQQGSLLLIGSTARTGRLVIKEALESGFKITAVARRPEALADVASPLVRRTAPCSAPLTGSREVRKPPGSLSARRELTRKLMHLLPAHKR